MPYASAEQPKKIYLVDIFIIFYSYKILIQLFAGLRRPQMVIMAL